MRNRHKIAIITVIAIAVIFVLFVRVKPFYDSPTNHVEELRQIPEVEAFYQKYKQHDITVFPDGVFAYQVGIQANKGANEWVMLRVNYLYGIPFSAVVICTPNGIDSQYRVTDNTLDYLQTKNCFENM